MYKKLSIKTLSIVFSALLILLILTEIMEQTKGKNTLRDLLFTINKEDVYTLKIYPRMLNGNEILIKKEDKNWLIKTKEKNFDADSNQINTLINTLSQLKPLRYAGKDEQQQKKYELSDSLCSKVFLMDKNGKELAAVRIGRFSFLQNKNAAKNPYMQQPQGTMITYVRMNDEKEIFAVEGYLSLMINQELNNFRNRKIISINKENIRKIEFEYPADSSFVLSQNKNKWLIGTETADSASVANYLNGITNITGLAFSKEELTQATHLLKITTNKNKVYEIKAQLTGNNKVLIMSSQNKTNIFEEKLNDQFETIFKKKQYFLKLDR